MTAAPAAEERCSRLNTEEPVLGTALRDRRILVVEQPGPWGRRALTDSELSPAAISGAVRSVDADCRVMVARHPARPRLGATRRWWSVTVEDEGVVARAGETPTGTALSGDVWAGSPMSSAPLVFVCTNGRRDPCCAAYGRALLNSCDGAPDVWEISHLGGHRFAPTSLRLPDALMTGRLGVAELSLLRRGAELGPEHVRGRPGRSPQRQIAEVAVAQQVGVPLAYVASTALDEEHVVVEAAGAWIVDLAPLPIAARAESCGAQPQSTSTWTVTAVAER